MTVDDITVIMEISSAIYPLGLPRKSDAIADIQQMKRAEGEIEGTHKTRVMYQLRSLNPGVSTTINDLIFLGHSSRTTNIFTVESADGKSLDVTTAMVIGYTIKVDVTARDVPPVTKKISLMFLQGDDSLTLGLRSQSGLTEKVAELADKGTVAERAVVLRFDHPEMPPADLPKEFAKDTRSARISQAKRSTAIYFNEIGFVDIEKLDRPVQLV